MTANILVKVFGVGLQLPSNALSRTKLVVDMTDFMNAVYSDPTNCRTWGRNYYVDHSNFGLECFVQCERDHLNWLVGSVGKKNR